MIGTALMYPRHESIENGSIPVGLDTGSLELAKAEGKKRQKRGSACKRL
jgi:hypothetical protein